MRTKRFVIYPHREIGIVKLVHK